MQRNDHHWPLALTSLCHIVSLDSLVTSCPHPASPLHAPAWPDWPPKPPRRLWGSVYLPLWAYWTCILYICYVQSYMNIECLYFSTLHSFLFFTTCFSFSYLFIFFFMHYWWGCKAKLIWCLLLCLLLLVFLMFNCYPPYFREFLFLLKW